MTEPDARVQKLLDELTLEEKCALTSGTDFWHTSPIERLGIPRLKVTDGPNGARGDSVSGETAACFPVGSALAASWDTDLIGQVGAALAAETRSKGAQVLLGPTVNLHRTPLAGRNFECYSEDPFLSGTIANAFIGSLQAEGVGACIKHYVANDSEFERHTISCDVDERTLRELYLRPFEMAVSETDPWSVMAAYNRVNSTYACAHRRLLTEVLREEWGWDGVIVSDWGAVKDTAETATAGLDLEMPGPGSYLGSELAAAITAGDVPEAAVDAMAERILTLLARSGRLDDPVEHPERSDDRSGTRALARGAAAAGMVLLKNDGGLLPLDRSALTTLAVIGPNAELATFQGGGSSRVFPHHESHPLEAIRDRCGNEVAVTFERGALTHKFLPELGSRNVAPSDGPDGPVTIEWFESADLSTAAVHTTALAVFGHPGFFLEVPDGLKGSAAVSCRYSATFVPTETGGHSFSLCSSGQARLLVDGVEVVDNWTDPKPGSWLFGFGSAEVIGQVDLTAGHDHVVEVEFGTPSNMGMLGMRVGMLPPIPDDLIGRAVRAAEAADAVVLVVGTTGEWETEGNDRESMDLPGAQNELIARVLDENPATVVVLNAGAPVAMPWRQEARSIMHTWFGGMEFGDALADVLFGDVEPGGRLPSTFPIRFEDCPAFLAYPGEGGHVAYGEGIFTGYRGYDETDTDVAFPFGHGLSYTTFEYGDIAAVERDNGMVEVTVPVGNTGDRAGTEVVQVYVHDVECSVRRPPRELKGFAKLHLDMGETAVAEIVLDRRAFAFWDPTAREWTVEPGKFEIQVGRSSRDIRGRTRITL